ncbi:Cytochrome P450 [Naviculisporaceae sp. PSN 640]
MVSSVLIASGAILACVVYSIVSGLRGNIQKAQKTGLVYVVSPVHSFNIIWQAGSAVFIPLVKKLPKQWWENWLPLTAPNWEYKSRMEQFDRLGTDTFILVTPGGMTLFTCDAEVIHQVTSRREAFPKDTTNYKVLAMFGNNVLVTEGAVWKMHRKTTSPSFNEKNAAHTFAEAISQTHGMMSMYFGDERSQSGSTKTITSLEKDTMTWALNIIGYVGFGLRLFWPGQELPKDLDPRLAKYGSMDPPPGYTMTFGQSLAVLLERIITLLVIPWPLLKRLPFEFAKQTWSAKENYLKYMDEFLKTKVDDTRKGVRETGGMDIMGQLVRSSYATNSTKQTAKLDDSEIIGNAFIMTVAGHETTANTLHFTLAELAINPAAQRALQKDIDSIFKGSDPSTWDYESAVNSMMASHIGACVNETLRLMPPVVQIPKFVSPHSEQAISIKGTQHVLPAGLGISLVVLSAQRNPRWWPTKPSDRTGASTDLDDFLPERWYRTDKFDENHTQEVEENEAGDYGGYQGANTSALLYRPARGSYTPFSDGARSCLGRRIAMVEMVAALAAIFQKYSIELAVDDWASDDEVEDMTREEKRRVYAKAQESARATIAEATTILTYEALRKSELELQLDEFLSENSALFQNDPKLANYFTSRARTAGSPVKRDPETRVVRRRATKAAEEIVAADDEDSSPQPTSATTALIQTPGRALALASRIPLPATPADVAQAVESGTVAVRERVASIYQESGITERTQATRENLSTVQSILFFISVFELYFLRPSLIPNKLAFTIPSIQLLNTNPFDVYLPDIFHLLTSSFWYPALTWAFTSFVAPAFFGYFFNLSAGNATTGGSGKGRHRAGYTEYTIDPLTFSIVKGIITYVVYAQGATFRGWIDPAAVREINNALYSGYKGVLVGAGVSALSALYDAALKK